MNKLVRKPISVGLVIAAMALPAPIARGQATDVSKSGASVQAEAPQFEVDSVRENKAGGGRSHIWSGSHDPNFRTQNVTLLTLLQFAYGLPETQILDLPSALRDKTFDIDAKADGMIEAMKSVSDDGGKLRKQQMVRALLKERFKLATHNETRALPVYELVVAKGGSKLHPTKSNGLLGNRNTNRIQGEGYTTETLARELSKVLGRVVVNKTGIDGRFDVLLRWTPEEEEAKAASSPDAPPSIFTAVQEQLGLKLEPAKGPVPVLVVDHAEMPTQN